MPDGCSNTHTEQFAGSCHGFSYQPTQNAMAVFCGEIQSYSFQTPWCFIKHKSWNNYRTSPTTNSADQNCCISLILAVFKSLQVPWCAEKPKPGSHYWYNWSRAGLGDLWWDQDSFSHLSAFWQGRECRGWAERQEAAWEACTGQLLFLLQAQSLCCNHTNKSQWCRRGSSPCQMPGPALKLHCPPLKWKQHLPTRDCRANSR